MKAGSLDRRITLQRQGAPVDDGYTTTPGAWGDLAIVWASYRASTGREALTNAETAATLPAEFRVRKSSITSTLTPKDRLVFNEVVYDIKQAVPVERDQIYIIAVARPDAS